MPTDAQMREWLLAEADEERMIGGERVPERGKLNDRLKAIYAEGNPPAGANGYDSGVTAADFGDDDMLAEDRAHERLRDQMGNGDGHADVTPETRPSRPRRSRSSRSKGGGSLIGHLLTDRKQAGGKGKTGSKAKKAPRVPLDKLATRGYMRVGQIMQGISPPTGRCLQAQAAMAGIMLEDILKDTVADRVLQPVARATDKLDKGFALLAPPAIVFALDVMPLPAEGAGPGEVMTDQMRRGLLTAMLRESLIISMEVAEDYASRVEENLTRHAEAEAKVDDLLRLIFEGPQVPEPEMAGAA